MIGSIEVSLVHQLGKSRRGSGECEEFRPSFGEEVEEVGRGAQVKGENAVEIVSALPLHA